MCDNMCMFMSAERLDNERRRGETAPSDDGASEPSRDFEVSEEQFEPRMSLWTVPEKWGGLFFFLLVLQGGILIGLHSWRTVVTQTDLHIVDTVLVEVLVAAPLLVFSGILSMIELEVALTLSRWYERRSIREDKEHYEAGRMVRNEARSEARSRRLGNRQAA